MTKLVIGLHPAVPPVGGGTAYIYRGVWLPCARREFPCAHNGEVWRGPRRESARTAAQISADAARQPLKLKRYKSDVGGLRPFQGGLLQRGSTVGVGGRMRPR